MLKLIVRRLLESIPLLLAISGVTFFLLFSSPGSYIDTLRQNPQVTQETLEAEIRRLGLDRPWYKVWASYTWGIVRHGDFGQSFTGHRPVVDVIKERLFNTFILALTSMIFAWLLAVPLGIAAAVRQNKLVDRAASFIAFIGLSIPAVLLALIAVYFAAVTGTFPTGGMTSTNYYLLESPWDKARDIARHLVLPTIVLGMGGLAIYTRQTRSNLLDTLKADYVRTAMAKGLTRRTAILRHAFRNAVNPLITLFGFAFSDLLSGAFIVENVMAYPGLGRTTMEAFFAKDLFLVAGSVLMASVMLIIGNLIADVVLALNDPRIRYD